MESMRVGSVDLRYAEHGTGRPVLVLHGAGVDHREPEACFEPALAAYGGLRRVYPDLPGSGQTDAPESLAAADDVLAVVVALVEHLAADGPVLVAGHSAGGYYARAAADRRPELVGGLALVCPLLAETRDVPEHRPAPVGEPHDEQGDQGERGDEGFRSYFVVHTQEMLDRYDRYVAPGSALADHAAMERIGERWELRGSEDDEPFAGPTLLVAGRLDSTVGYAATAGLLDRYPAATLAVLDGAGHALPHEKPALLGALVTEWLSRCETGDGPGQ